MDFYKAAVFSLAIEHEEGIRLIKEPPISIPEINIELATLV
jgi:hypothetical protein